MNLDQINQLINRGGAALGLALIAFILLYWISRNEDVHVGKRAR